MTKNMKEKKWFLSSTEYALLNEKFNKKYPNYKGGRIEMHHKDHQYAVAEMQIILPAEMYDKLTDAIQFKEIDFFQFGDIHSELLEENLKK